MWRCLFLLCQQNCWADGAGDCWDLTEMINCRTSQMFYSSRRWGPLSSLLRGDTLSSPSLLLRPLHSHSPPLAPTAPSLLQFSPGILGHNTRGKKKKKKRCFHITVNLLQSEPKQKHNILKMPSSGEKGLLAKLTLPYDPGTLFQDSH